MSQHDANLEKISKELQEKFPQKELGMRLLSAGVLLPFGVCVVFLGGYLYAATLFCLCCILAWEYVRLWCPEKFAREFALYISALVAIMIGFFSDMTQAPWVYLIATVIILAIVSRKIWVIGGIVVLAFFLHFGLEFRLSETQGMAACVLLCATAWGGDTGAFVAGRLFGGARLAPLISPKKTWSGLWGALSGGAFFTSLMALFLSVPITVNLIVWAVACSSIGVAGDLFESWMKRIARVKDTSDLIPGHGGLLDRFDGLLGVVLVNGGVIMLSGGAGSFADIIADVTGPLMGSISILGVTGSIGQNTLKVLRQYPHEFTPIAFTAHSDVAGLVAAALEFCPQFVALADESQKAELQSALAGQGIACGVGKAAILDAAAMSSDIVLCAIAGAAALRSTFIAARRGAKLALANKESIVCAGALLKAEVSKSGGAILPVDSEHSALFRLLHHVDRSTVKSLVLTASGGAFREFTPAQLQAATPEQALKHPTWNMGRKITIDSATLMNKGLELIEASILFDMPEAAIDVVLEPRSLIHALVQFVDGSMTAEYSHPDMCLPIAAALFWPLRKALPTKALSLTDMGAIEFLQPDLQRFPALNLARAAARDGKALPIVFNAANEMAVEAFLKRKIGFLEITTLVEQTMNAYIQQNGSHAPQALEDVVAVDMISRTITGLMLTERHLL